MWHPCIEIPNDRPVYPNDLIIDLQLQKSLSLLGELQIQK